jgi:hypothetical protein
MTTSSSMSVKPPTRLPVLKKRISFSSKLHDKANGF